MWRFIMRSTIKTNIVYKVEIRENLTEMCNNQLREVNQIEKSFSK